MNTYIVVGGIAKTDRTDTEFNYISSAIYIISNKGEVVGRYISVMPFPFNGTIIPGKDFPVFSTDFGKFGISSCWEETFTYINKIYVKSGADFIINASNDALLNSINIMKLKAMFSQSSAAENHQYIIRAANTGFTEIINPYGKVVASLEPNKEGVLVADIYVK